MGKKSDGDIGGPTKPHDKHRPWERTRAEVTAKLDEAELRRVVEVFTWENFDGHAYSPKELKEIRKILQLSEDEWPDKILHRHTDELVALIGPNLAVASRETGKVYESRIKRKLLNPAQRFLDALEDPELEVEFLLPWSPMETDQKDNVADKVREFMENAQHRVDQIRQVSRKGKSWDSDIKDQYVEYVDFLCDYLDNDFEPTRVVSEGQEYHGRFRDMVYLLARPLEWGDHKDSKITFEGAIRKYVDSWNARKAQHLESLDNKHG